MDPVQTSLNQVQINNNRLFHSYIKDTDPINLERAKSIVRDTQQNILDRSIEIPKSKYLKHNMLGGHKLKSRGV